MRLSRSSERILGSVPLRHPAIPRALAATGGQSLSCRQEGCPADGLMPGEKDMRIS